MVSRLVAKLIAPLQRRVMLMIGRAVVRAIADGGGLQVLQLSGLAGEVLDGVERFQEYGFTSHPHPGAEAAVVFVGGNRSHGIVIAVDDRLYRLVGLAEGEVALYDDQGQVVHIKRNGVRVSGLNIHLVSDGVIRIEGDGVEMHGRTYVQTDVAGRGERRTHAGGTAYTDDTYTTGADVTAAEHGLNQPALPSDHPDAGGA
jgi:phage baseplate assembly protein V